VEARENVPLSEWLVAGADANVAQRARIYADAYAFRMVDCLADEFPSVARLLGDAFAALALDYVARHPPSHPSLRHLGATFASFVAEHPVVRRWPWLADLAALDWARAEAFDASDVPRLTLAELAAIAPDRWPGRTFRLAPAVRLLTLRHAVHLVWRALEDGAPPPAAEAARTHVVVWRRGHVVCHRVAHAHEAEALRRAQRGAPFAHLCECLTADGSLEQAAGQALGFLQQWIADGLLVP
jgi:hypothetical protein